MNRRILFVFVAVAFVAIVASPSAKADCGSPQQLATAFTDTGTNYYVVFNTAGPLAQDMTNATVVGRFWDANNKANINNDGGGCPEEYFSSAISGTQWAVDGYIGGNNPFDPTNTQRCVNNGACMSFGTSLILVFETKTLDGKGAAFAAGRVKNSFEVAGSGTTTDYDYSRTGADFVMTPVPRPRVTNSSRTTTTINLNLHYDDTSTAIHLTDGFTASNTLVSYKLLEGTGATDPGRNPASWATVKRTDANPGGAVDITGVPIDCTNPAVPHWIALLPQFQGGSFGPVDGTYVGEAVKINCDPTLAQPKDVKPIGKKKITQ